MTSSDLGALRWEMQTSPTAHEVRSGDVSAPGPDSGRHSAESGAGAGHFLMSKRSSSMTFTQASTKSLTNFVFASSLA